MYVTTDVCFKGDTYNVAMAIVLHAYEVEFLIEVASLLLSKIRKDMDATCLGESNASCTL